MHLLLKALDSYMCHFNNIAGDLLLTSLALVVAIKAFLFHFIESKQSVESRVISTVVQMKHQQPSQSYQQETLNLLKGLAPTDQNKILYENTLLWFVQAERLI